MSEITYQIIRADGSTERRSHVLPDDRASIYRAVVQIVSRVIGPDAHLEHVNVYDEGRYKDMFVDETGHLKSLPYNKLATKIYHRNYRKHRPDEYCPKIMPKIVGNAVLFNEKVWR